MSARQGPKRYHHTLPRLYLKGFVEKEGSAFIWEYRKNSSTNPNPERQSIGRPCATQDYYAHVADDGTIDFETVENQLEQFEKRSDAILEKLRATVLLSPDEKSEFAFYLTQMLWRVPWQRKRLAELLPGAVEAVQPSARAHFNLPDNDETKAMIDRVVAATKTSEYQQRLHVEILATTTPSEVTEAFKAMTWRFFVAPDDLKFATSDNPIFFDHGLGLNHERCEVSFAVSSDIALVASRWSSAREGFFNADSQVVKELNRRALSQATTKAYYHQRCDWLLPIMRKQRRTWRAIH